MSDAKTFQTVKTHAIARAFVIERQGIDEAARTAPLSFASETPCFEPELDAYVILDHSPGAADFSRMEGGPVFVQHNDSDQVAVAEGCEISADRKSRAVARFSKAVRASEIFNDVKDGIRRQVSVRATLQKLVIDSVKDGVKTLRAVRWTPLEMSIVGLAKDASVGVMRDENAVTFNTEVEVIRSETISKEKETTMAEDNKAIIETTRSETLNGERARITNIGASVKHALELYPEAATTIRALEVEHVSKGTSHADFNTELLGKMPGFRKVERSEAKPSGELGLSEKETKRFSIVRAINALAEKNWDTAGFELECSRAIEKRVGKPAHGGFYVPYEVQARKAEVKRDQTVASASGGGYLVATDNRADSFIELLRNRTVVAQMGATILPGLTGNVTIPKQTAASTAYWLVNEGTQITESALTFGQLALTPKTVGAYVEISRLSTLQTIPAIDALVMDDVAKVVALAVDLAAINGSGSNGEPQGLIGTSGIGSVTGTSVDYADMIEFQTDVASANALVAGAGFVTTPTVAGLLMARQRFSSTDTPLWTGNLLDGQLVGYRAMSSNQVPAGYLLFGDWSSVIIGEWGILEVAVNPYANFQAGVIGVRAFQTVDVGVRRAGAFSVASSVT